MDFGTHRQALGGFEPYRTRCESPGAPNTKFRDPIAPAHRAGAARELGVHRGLIIAERERLGTDHAYAIAGARNRNTELHSQAEEAHNSLSAREAGIAVADANSSCRQPAPNYRNERHALAPEKRREPRGRRRRRPGKKPPPLGGARQTDQPRVKIRPKMAVLNGSVRRVVWWLGARHHARPDEARQTRDSR
ncbi:putative trans-sialidase [Trypanosoma cruzi]|nr:putative trans-sialidase [Trypanosoma cruzi]